MYTFACRLVDNLMSLQRSCFLVIIACHMKTRVVRKYIHQTSFHNFHFYSTGNPNGFHIIIIDVSVYVNWISFFVIVTLP